MTARLYETDGHCRQFDAVVTACEPRGNRFAVELDRTAFFPEGGGQYADTGTINGIPVQDVRIENGRLWHYAENAIAPGTAVIGELDWEQRFSRMQHHSGEHIVSGLIHQLFQFDNVGFHLGHHDTTLDFNGELTRDQLMDIERRANAVVSANLPVLITFPSDEELNTLPYRSKKELEGDVRIVTIPEVDMCACCAPHVTLTGEIGGIKLLDAIRYKGGMRVHMLCGARAFDAFETLYREVSAAAAALSAKTEELSAAVDRLMAAKEDALHTVAAWRREWVAVKAETLPSGEPVCAVFLPQAESDTLQALVNSALEKQNVLAAAFAGDEESGFVGVIGSDRVDMRLLSERLKSELHARGGGRDARWQGRVTASKEAITALLEDAAK